MKITYHTESCNRCGGSGSYSYCQRYGSVCFGCGGNGKQLTKKAKYAKKRITAVKSEQFTILASEVTEGMTIMASIKFMGEDVPTKVTGVSISDAKYQVGEDMVPYVSIDVSRAGKSATLNACATSKIQRVPTKEEWRESLLPVARRLSGCTILD